MRSAIHRCAPPSRTIVLVAAAIQTWLVRITGRVDGDTLEDCVGVVLVDLNGTADGRSQKGRRRDTGGSVFRAKSVVANHKHNLQTAVEALKGFGTKALDQAHNEAVSQTSQQETYSKQPNIQTHNTRKRIAYNLRTLDADSATKCV